MVSAGADIISVCSSACRKLRWRCTGITIGITAILALAPVISLPSLLILLLLPECRDDSVEDELFQHSLSVNGECSDAMIPATQRGNTIKSIEEESTNRRPILQRATAWLLEGSRDRLIALELALLLVVGLSFGLGLRLGPQGLLASSGVEEGERFVHCAENEQHQGKLMLHLVKGEGLVTSEGMVSPYGKLRVAGVVKDSRFARFGWKSNLDVPTHHNDANPDWASDSGGTRFFCIDGSTLASISDKEGGDGKHHGILLEVWDYNYLYADEAIGTASLDEVVRRAVNDFGHPELFSAQLAVLDAAGKQKGVVEVGAKWFPAVELDSLLPVLSSADVILFSGDTYSGRVIKSWTKSEWSHVGVVSAEPGAELSVLEASTNKAQLRDCDDKKALYGVERLGLLDKTYSGFYDRVAVRLLIFRGESLQADLTRSIAAGANSSAPAILLRKQTEEKVHRFYQAQRGKPYEEFRADMVASAFSFATEFGNESLFCSEFAAAGFIEAGIWQTDKIPSNVMPDEFASEGRAKPDFMADYAHLSNEIYIRRPQRFPKGRCYERPGLCQCGGSQGVPYADSMACWAEPCDSMLEWWFGSAWDAGFGLDVEICILSCALLWSTACLLGNLIVLSRHRRWRTRAAWQASKVSPLLPNDNFQLATLRRGAAASSQAQDAAMPGSCPNA